MAAGTSRPGAFSLCLAPVAAISFSRDYIRSFVCLAQGDFVFAGASLRLAKDGLTSQI